MLPKVSWADCKAAWARWGNHDASRLGAALAFYSLLSLAPLSIFVITVVAIVFGRQEAQSWILAQVTHLIGPQGASAVQNTLLHANQASSGFIAGVIGMLTLLFGASGVFTELRNGLNTVWDLRRQDTSGLKGIAKSRLFSFGMVLAVGFLLLVSLILNTALAAIIEFFGHLIPFPAPLLELVNFVISIYGIAILFALIFKYVPDARICWRDVWSGALFTSLLFTAGKLLLGYYLGVASVGSAYGAAGSLVAVIVWIYYSAQIFYYGAEVTWVHAASRTPNLQKLDIKSGLGELAK